MRGRQARGASPPSGLPTLSGRRGSCVSSLDGGHPLALGPLAQPAPRGSEPRLAETRVLEQRTLAETCPALCRNSVLTLALGPFALCRPWSGRSGRTRRTRTNCGGSSATWVDAWSSWAARTPRPWPCRACSPPTYRSGGPSASAPRPPCRPRLRCRRPSRPFRSQASVWECREWSPGLGSRCCLAALSNWLVFYRADEVDVIGYTSTQSDDTDDHSSVQSASSDSGVTMSTSRLTLSEMEMV